MRFLACLLWLPGRVYGGVQRARRALYRRGILPSRRLSRPVISIGGLRAGGSGKTPFTCWVARGLREKGYRVAVLTRGYGRVGSRGPLILHGGGGARACDPDRFGDEPCLLADALSDVPVGVDARRYRGGVHLMRRFPVDVFVLDDGFQHRSLARDCDIVLVPRGDEPERMACLPRGPLREPASALRDAHMIVRVAEGAGEADGPGPEAWEARMLPGALRSVESSDTVDPRTVPEQGVFAFCGIARPESFWRSLEAVGLRVRASRAYPDHHRYSRADHRELLEMLRRHAGAVTTAKDAVKLARYTWPPGKLLVLEMCPVVSREADFWRVLEGYIRRG